MGKLFGIPSVYLKHIEIHGRVVVNESFFECADIQLSEFIEFNLGIGTLSNFQIAWAPEDRVFYDSTTNSNINIDFWIKSCKLKASVNWSSKSGRVYDLRANGVDCEDIIFELQGLDFEICKKILSPNWILIKGVFGLSEYCSFIRYHNLDVSFAFLECAGIQLPNLFERITGIKMNKNVSFNLVETSYDLAFKDAIHHSTLKSVLYVNHNWNPITIYWKSKTGKEYKVHDIIIDCNDIEFWFEKLDTELYLKQLYPNDKLPFKLKDLSFELVVTRINLDCSINIELKPAVIEDRDAIIDKLYQFVADFNTKSEKRNRQCGVIHNCSATVVNEGNLLFDLDLGSAGVSGLKKLLQYMSDLVAFKRVELQ